MKQNLIQFDSILPTLVPRCGQSVLITIDGPAGSGKTTLANSLGAKLASSYTVHMDDLYEGWQSTLTPELTIKLNSLLARIRDKSQVAFRPYDWQKNELSEPINIPAPQYLILEGVGSGQGAIRKFASLALWIEVPESQGLARVILRDGPQVADQMVGFLAVQSAYFLKEDPKKSADYRLSGLETV
ncbi:MAG: (d)CMP kinase [Actinomycetota bacterium]